MSCIFCKLDPDVQDFAEALCQTTDLGSCPVDMKIEKEEFNTRMSFKSEANSVNVTFDTIIQRK